MLKRLILALLMATPAMAQTSFYTDRALQQVNVLTSPTPLTAAIPYGPVRVCSLPLTQQSPCLPLAPITDINGNAISNSIGPLFGQLTTDATGRFTFGCTLGNNYQVQVTQSASNTPAVNYPITCPGVGTNPQFGAITINGTPNLSSGNVANKAAAADGVRYVSNSGNDLNDGLSEGTAKLTIAGACASLTGGNLSCSAGAGTIYVAPTFTGTFLAPAASGISLVERTNANAGGGWNWFTLGSFANSQMTELIESDVNGCSAKTEFQYGQGPSNFASDGISGCMAVPSSSTQINGNASSGYMNSASTTTNAVAGYFSARALANNVKIWGINPVCTDGEGGASLFTGVTCKNEFDIGISSTTTIGQGVQVAGSFTAQPVVYPAFHVARPTQNGGGCNVSGANNCGWTQGLLINDGAVNGGAGIQLGKQFLTGSTSSQFVTYSSNNGTTGFVGNTVLDPNGTFLVRPGGATFSFFQNGAFEINGGSLQVSNPILDATGSNLTAPFTKVGCTTSQKSETAADANVLTCTPAAVAGSYRISLYGSISAASAATLGWTATWTDSNGNVATPTNLPVCLASTGVCAATTGALSAVDRFSGNFQIDINNAGTGIVIKLTFSGTSFTAKVSATVERII